MKIAYPANAPKLGDTVCAITYDRLRCGEVCLMVVDGISFTDGKMPHGHSEEPTCMFSGHVIYDGGGKGYLTNVREDYVFATRAEATAQLKPLRKEYQSVKYLLRLPNGDAAEAEKVLKAKNIECYGDNSDPIHVIVVVPLDTDVPFGETLTAAGIEWLSCHVWNV